MKAKVTRYAVVMTHSIWDGPIESRKKAVETMKLRRAERPDDKFKVRKLTKKELKRYGYR